MFAGQSDKYDEFRAKFKIWLPALTTLDGIDFAKDMGKISEMRDAVEVEKSRALQSKHPLASIPEEAKGQGSSG